MGRTSGLWSPSHALAAVAVLPFVPSDSESSRLGGNLSDWANVQTRTFALPHSHLFTCAGSGSEGLASALGVPTWGAAGSSPLGGGSVCSRCLRAEVPEQTGQDCRRRPFEGSPVQREFVETHPGGLSWPGCPSLCCAELGNALCARQNLLGSVRRSLGPVACSGDTCQGACVGARVPGSAAPDGPGRGLTATHCAPSRHCSYVLHAAQHHGVLAGAGGEDRRPGVQI